MSVARNLSKIGQTNKYALGMLSFTMKLYTTPFTSLHYVTLHLVVAIIEVYIFIITSRNSTHESVPFKNSVVGL